MDIACLFTSKIWLYCTCCKESLSCKISTVDCTHKYQIEQNLILTKENICQQQNCVLLNTCTELCNEADKFYKNERRYKKFKRWETSY